MMPGMPPPLPATGTTMDENYTRDTSMSKKTTAIIGGAIAAVAVLTCLALLLMSWILKRRAARRKELSRVSCSKFSEFSFENSIGEESSMMSVDPADTRCSYVVSNGHSSNSGPSPNTSRSDPNSYTNFPNVPLYHTVTKEPRNEPQFEDQACSLTRSSSSYSRSSVETVTPRTSMSEETSEIDLSQCAGHPIEGAIACSLYANVKSSEQAERTGAVLVEPLGRVPTSKTFWRLAHPVERFGSVI